MLQWEFFVFCFKTGLNVFVPSDSSHKLFLAMDIYFKKLKFYSNGTVTLSFCSSVLN